MIESGEKMELDAEALNPGEKAARGFRGMEGMALPGVPPPPVTVREALSAALRDYIVRRDELMTVIAGYPWFLDWGRDTFIVLRGMIADGMTRESLDIVRKFGHFELGDAAQYD